MGFLGREWMRSNGDTLKNWIVCNHTLDHMLEAMIANTNFFQIVQFFQFHFEEEGFITCMRSNVKRFNHWAKVIQVRTCLHLVILFVDSLIIRQMFGEICNVYNKLSNHSVYLTIYKMNTPSFDIKNILETRCINVQSNSFRNIWVIMTTEFILWMVTVLKLIKFSSMHCKRRSFGRSVIHSFNRLLLNTTWGSKEELSSSSKSSFP